MKIQMLEAAEAELINQVDEVVDSDCYFLLREIDAEQMLEQVEYCYFLNDELYW